LSSAIEIFAAFPGSLTDFAEGVHHLLGISFEFVRDAKQDNSFDRYEARVGDVEVTVVSATGLEGDEFVRTQDYNYYVSVVGLGHAFDPQVRGEEQDSFSRSIYERLKATGRYRLMLVDDMKEKMDEFNP